jgi:hypothetical protein
MWLLASCSTFCHPTDFFLSSAAVAEIWIHYYQRKKSGKSTQKNSVAEKLKFLVFQNISANPLSAKPNQLGIIYHKIKWTCSWYSFSVTSSRNNLFCLNSKFSPPVELYWQNKKVFVLFFYSKILSCKNGNWQIT